MVTFTKVGSDYFIGTKLFAKAFNGGFVINESLSSKFKSFEDMESYVTFKASLTGPIMLTKEFNKFFDAKSRFDEFMKTGATPGVSLTDEEARVAATLASVKAKFEAIYGSVQAEDLRQYAAMPAAYEHRDDIIDYYIGHDRNATIPKGLRVRDRFRVVTNAKGEEVVHAPNGSEIPLLKIKNLWERYVRKAWATTSPVSNRDARPRHTSPYLSLSGWNNYLEVYGNRVEFGCQTVSRWAVERLAREQGWLDATA